jgi:signal transduction histidine kinase
VKSSLRSRIFLATTVTMSVVVLVGSCTVWLGARTVLLRTLDDEIRTRGHGLAHQPLHRGPAVPRLDEEARPGGADDGHHPPQAPALPPEFRGADARFVLQAINPQDGHELTRSPSLPRAVSLLLLLPPAIPDEHPCTIRFPDGREFRLQAFSPPGPGRRGEDHESPPVRLLVAADLGPLQGDLNRLALVLGALWILTTVIGALVAVWLQRVVLRPLTGIAQAIAAVDPSELSARIALDEVPLEMAAVTARLNELLGRLDAAFCRERATIANIAHELRTPVAGLLMTIDLALSKTGSGPQGEALHRCQDIASTMQVMITNLLVLARIEAGQQPASPEMVALEVLLGEVWDLHATQAAERHMTLTREGLAPPQVWADPAQVRMIVGNLLANALAYAPRGSNLTVTFTPRAATVAMTLANPFDGSLRDCTHVFEPFWRGDAARAVGLHCGLGLTLVQRLVVANAGTVAATITDAGCFAVTVTLPTA